MRRVVLPVLALLCCHLAPAAAETYKCRSESGAVTYGDKPCAADAGQNYRTPRTVTVAPWLDQPFRQCCPDACWRLYESKRKTGATPMAAMDQALFGGGVASASCLRLR